MEKAVKRDTLWQGGRRSMYARVKFVSTVLQFHWPTVLSTPPLAHCVVCLWRFVLWQNGTRVQKRRVTFSSSSYFFELLFRV